MFLDLNLVSESVLQAFAFHLFGDRLLEMLFQCLKHAVFNNINDSHVFILNLLKLIV